MSDRLYYDVIIRVDDTTLASAKEKIDSLGEALRSEGFKEGAAASEEFSAVMEKLNTANLEAIDILVALDKEISRYKERIAEIIDKKEEKNQVSQAELREEQSLKAALKATQKEYRDKQASVIANQEAAEGATSSYRQVSAAVRNWKQELFDLPLDATTERKRQLITQIREGNEQLKEFDATLGDHRRNVGNYAETLGIAAGAVASVQGPLGPIAGRISSINSTIARSIPLLRAKAASWGLVGVAMAATGIPLLVAAIYLLVKALRTAQPFLDATRRTMDAISAVMGNVIERFGAFLGITEGTTLSMRDAARQARDLRDAKIELAEATMRATIAEAELEAQISRLRLEAEDEENSHRRRIDFMNEAIEATQKLFDIRIELQAETVRIMKEELDMTSSTREEREKLADETARLIQLEGQRDQQLRQVTRRRQTIINSLRVEIERRERNIQRIREESAELIRASQRRITALRREEAATLEEYLFSRQVDRLRAHGNERQIIELQYQRNLLLLQEQFESKKEEILLERQEWERNQIRLHRKLILSDEQAFQQAQIEAQARFGDEIQQKESSVQDARKRQEERFLAEVGNLYVQSGEEIRGILEQGALDVTEIGMGASYNAVRVTRERIETVGDLERIGLSRFRDMRKKNLIDLEEDQLDHLERMLELRTNKSARERQVAKQHQEEISEIEKQIRHARMDEQEFINKRSQELLDDNLTEEEIALRVSAEARERYGQRIVELSKWLTETEKRLARERSDSLMDEETGRVNRIFEVHAEHFNALREIRSLHNSLEQGLIEGRDERIIMLEHERNHRERDLKEQYRQEGIDDLQATLMAEERARMEYARRIADAEKAIWAEKEEFKRQRTEANMFAVIDIMGIAFENNKAFQVAEAIAEGYLAVQRARASAPPPLNTALAIAEAAAAARNVANILRTKPGDRSLSGGGGAPTMTRGFEVVERNSEFPIAAQVASEASSRSGEESPTFIFQGDLDNEVMAIRVRQGNRMVDTKTLTTKSRN